MATSSKVQFNLETLKAKALESIEFRIARKRLHVDSFEDDEALADRITEWRVAQEQKVRDLLEQIDAGRMDDHRLAKFRIDPIPEVDQYERRGAVRDLEALESLKTKIEAKSEALVPDEQGNVSLTKTQMAEFFGL